MYLGDQGDATNKFCGEIDNVTFTGSNAPLSPSFDASSDGDIEWSYSGEFNQSNNRTSDFYSELNSYLNTCPNDPCDIPLLFRSDDGILEISDIDVELQSASEVTILPLGVWNYSCSVVETQNYTSNSTYQLYEVVSYLTLSSITLTPGTIVNPVENSNVSMTSTVNITNSSSITNCYTDVYNSSTKVFSSLTGTLRYTGSTLQCNSSWNMDYWRNPGNWMVNMTTTGSLTNSTTQNFTYNTLQAVSINVSYINFNGTPGQTVNSSTAYPLQIINIGNDILNLSVKADDFVGVTNPSFKILKGNCTYNETSTGEFRQMTSSYYEFKTDLSGTQTQNLFFRGFMPNIINQNYQGIIYIQGV